MLSQNKGVYPNWINDKDIIQQVLNEIALEGGRLPYSFVINPEHAPEIQERMKRILEQMQEEKLIFMQSAEDSSLEIDIAGSRAVQNGYRKYRRIKNWNLVITKLSRITIIFLLLLAFAMAGGLLYFILHHFFKAL